MRTPKARNKHRILFIGMRICWIRNILIMNFRLKILFILSMVAIAVHVHIHSLFLECSFGSSFGSFLESYYGNSH